MNRFEEKLDNISDPGELEDIRHQLFRENVRIQAERAQIEADLDELHRERLALASERKQLQREKRQLSIEMNQLRESVEYERKRLKDDERMLDKKQKLIQRSYSLFDEDRAKLKEERRIFGCDPSADHKTAGVRRQRIRRSPYIRIIGLRSGRIQQYDMSAGEIQFPIQLTVESSALRSNEVRLSHALIGQTSAHDLLYLSVMDIYTRPKTHTTRLTFSSYSITCCPPFEVKFAHEVIIQEIISRYNTGFVEFFQVIE